VLLFNGLIISAILNTSNFIDTIMASGV